MKSEYKIKVVCDNCDYGHTGYYEPAVFIKITLGKTVKSVKCPKCQCKTLRRIL